MNLKNKPSDRETKEELLEELEKLRKELQVENNELRRLLAEYGFETNV